ncbi:helix-turn-helix transcriptional regulator [Nocardia farcinica]|nr:helix-turn-helix transcriptional regulator [Nocardia farcinica]MBF6308616.1 helix-turn-helix transcriptional regulator [Nocardia farcinica]MBF6393009.1 helix-turn-helix transcriptional regulator [Nocardia farcinica]MBF6511253.1 helix-turn-helix transcriptional regulator [Nocardia farcinica]MBF6527616.1 helix-turn-helix transcriptional regulator [Nocardia farcinica]
MAEATVNDIVERAGTSKRTFYQHFADKEERFLALYRTASFRVCERVQNAMATGDPGSERLRDGMREMPVPSKRSWHWRGRITSTSTASAPAASRLAARSRTSTPPLCARPWRTSTGSPDQPPPAA